MGEAEALPREKEGNGKSRAWSEGGVCAATGPFSPLTMQKMEEILRPLAACQYERGGGLQYFLATRRINPKRESVQNT